MGSPKRDSKESNEDGPSEKEVCQEDKAQEKEYGLCDFCTRPCRNDYCHTNSKKGQIAKRPKRSRMDRVWSESATLLQSKNSTYFLQKSMKENKYFELVLTEIFRIYYSTTYKCLVAKKGQYSRKDLPLLEKQRVRLEELEKVSRSHKDFSMRDDQRSLLLRRIRTLKNSLFHGSISKIKQ